MVPLTKEPDMEKLICTVTIICALFTTVSQAGASSLQESLNDKCLAMKDASACYHANGNYEYLQKGKIVSTGMWNTANIGVIVCVVFAKASEGWRCDWIDVDHEMLYNAGGEAYPFKVSPIK